MVFREFAIELYMWFMPGKLMISYLKHLKSVGELRGQGHVKVKPLISISAPDSVHLCNVSASVLTVSVADFKDTVLWFCLK